VDTKLRTRLQFFEMAVMTPQNFTRPVSAPLRALKGPDVSATSKKKEPLLRRVCFCPLLQLQNDVVCRLYISAVWTLTTPEGVT
jgi:hypothetical protein